MICGGSVKEKYYHSFLTVFLFQSLPDHLHPNFLSPWSLSPQSLAPWLLAPQRSLPYCYFLPITCSLIAQLIRFTRSLVFCCPTCSLIAWLLFLLSSKNSLHSPIYIPLINPQSPWSSAVDCLLIHIADTRYIAPTDLVPGLLLSSLVFWYQIFHWFSKILLPLALHTW